MSNPFDNEDGIFRVLRNDLGEYSLWPDFSAVPEGWSVQVEGVSRADGTAYVDQHWVGL
ncbi:MbtH family NRPS accessory protein [Nocardia sp. SYP-A9097]|uniref:MbtH family protein n=1 Tax=Nocardia sp. SYP-A9097 TaxID=2663237 RepID=UPI001323194B|nr:MbtH family protein [Nocardia sp. SYP-A9097]MRH90277.1 MbtH family NRPS accessory protein [Nocardia sp. SYP-A9097]